MALQFALQSRSEALRGLLDGSAGSLLESSAGCPEGVQGLRDFQACGEDHSACAD